MERATPNSRRSVSATRPVVEGTCLFDYESVDFGIRLGVRRTSREANDMRTIGKGRQPMASIDRSIFASVDDEPRQGDRFEATEYPDLAPFEIQSVERDGQSRFVLRMVQEGAQG